jgi:hypothetical protein
MAEPFALSVPESTKVCVPATAVSVTFWPLMVTVTGVDPLLQGPGAEADEVME